MKLSCEKALLQAAIVTAQRAVSPKSSIAAIEGLLLETDGDLLLVTGYNLETGIRTVLDAEVEESGEIVLPARLFSDIVRRLPDDIVTIKTEKLSVNIRCGQSVFNLTGIDPLDFPALPEVDREHSFAVTEAALREMLGQTLFSVSDNESRPIHTGALFDVTREQLTIVGVDGFRLAMRRETLHESEGEFSFVTPAVALSEVEKICRDTRDELVTVTMAKRHVTFRMGRTMLVSRRLEGEFFAWKNAVPRDHPIGILAGTKELLEAMERVSLMISDRIKTPLRLRLAEGELFLTTRTPTGDASDHCLVEGDGEGLQIGFNHRYLIDILRALPAERVRMEFSTSVSPCVFSPEEEGDDSFLYMVLPVRIRPDPEPEPHAE